MSNLKKGIHIKEEDFSKSARVFVKDLVARRVILPLCQHTGKPARPLVKVKQPLKAGEKIAELDGFISSPIHSSVSGEVTNIEDYFHPVLGRGKAIFIKSDIVSTVVWQEKIKKDIDVLSKDELVEKIKESGIVGLGGAVFPAYVKLSPSKDYEIDTLLINGCECEPFLSSDDLLMQKFPFQIIKGIQILQKIIAPKNTFITIEDNKQFALERMRQAVVLNKNMEVKKLKTAYPQGAEKQLIKSLLNREVPPQGLPFQIGVIVFNVATCFAVYEAVYKDKPLIDRYVTLSGDCVKEPGVYSIPIGMVLSDLIKDIGGFKEEPKKIIFGGPMMGLSQVTLDMPITKATSGILFFSEKQSLSFKEYPCIKCARCVDICPMNLLSNKIAQFAKHGKFDLVAEYNAIDCMECGCCEYICPSRIPLVQYIRIGKNNLTAAGIKK